MHERFPMGDVRARSVLAAMLALAALIGGVIWVVSADREPMTTNVVSSAASSLAAHGDVH